MANNDSTLENNITSNSDVWREEDSLAGYTGDTQFSNIMGAFTAPKPIKAPSNINYKFIAQIGSLVLILSACVYVYFTFLHDTHPVTANQPVIREITKAPPAVNLPKVAEVVEKSTTTEGDFVSNWPKPKYTTNRAITMSEEGLWLSELFHEYPYRRYKVVFEARRMQLAGSESFFIKALNQGGFWLRMQAVFALAEMGADVTAEHVQRAIGDARTSLVKNYFKRFKGSSTEGERYVMSLAMFFVNEEAQNIIGEGLSTYSSNLVGQLSP